MKATRAAEENEAGKDFLELAEEAMKLLVLVSNQEPVHAALQGVEVPMRFFDFLVSCLLDVPSRKTGNRLQSFVHVVQQSINRNSLNTGLE